mmetsp:Transcript_56457/g.145366  ORF Transcript_56457/g.145366 Transcript_56457/m.145366 type:complete len:437 (-) Transcript_56457:118-1428(-)
MAAMLRRMNTAGETQEYPMPKEKYGFGISWDAQPGRAKVDLDLQCVVVDSAGTIVDCAYYNNLKAARGITHSGDEATGAAAGIDELVWVALPKLPENIAVLVFVIAAYAGGKLIDAANGFVHVLETTKQNEIAKVAVERSNASVDVVGAMYRTPAGWKLQLIEEPGVDGQHFMDILPTINNVIKRFIPNAPKRQKVAFAMEKGGVLDLPTTMDAITIGLGWDTDSGEVDLDVSAVLLDSGHNQVTTVFFGNTEAPEHGVKHSGDNLTGAGAGDDEQIVCNLQSVGAQVQQIVFVINIYTPARTFQQVANPYCRVVNNATGEELCRYSLREAGSETGLIVSKMAREAGGRWGFHALGLPCRGRTYKDSLAQIMAVCGQDTRKLMVRTGSEWVSNAGNAHSAPISSALASHSEANPQMDWNPAPVVTAGNCGPGCTLQ